MTIGDNFIDETMKNKIKDYLTKILIGEECIIMKANNKCFNLII